MEIMATCGDGDALVAGSGFLSSQYWLMAVI